MHDTQLIGAALAGIGLVLLLIIKLRQHAFVALLIGALVIGLIAGMPVDDLLASMVSGAAGTLGAIAVIIGLGGMFGQMLEISGGAKVLSERLIATIGENRAPWAMMLAGFIVSIPVFLDVAFILLISLVYGLTRKTGKSSIHFALPLLAGLAVTHAFIPPTPGPIAVAALLDADLGLVMGFGILVGLPAAILAGPVYTRFIAPRINASVPDYMEINQSELSPSATMPSAAMVMALVLLPLLLILGNTASALMLDETHLLRQALGFFGNPMMALLITCLLSFELLGVRCGYSREQVRDVATRALEPAGIVILVTCAGGILKQVLIDSGVGDSFATLLASTSMPLLVLAWLVAAAVRTMQGSATVAMLTAGGLLASLIGDQSLTEAQLALMVIAIAAGATFASHVNDSAFWLVNRYLGLSVPDTFRTWTAATTIISVVALVMVLMLNTLL